MPVRIGELLLKEKRITAEQLQQALSAQKAQGGKLGFNLSSSIRTDRSVAKCRGCKRIAGHLAGPWQQKS